MLIKGLIFKEIGNYPEIGEIEADLLLDDITVSLKAAALNHRDVWITKGQYAGIQTPCILGSDGAGMVNDKRVLIQPGFDWGSDDRFQSRQYSILGMPRNGTFANIVNISSKNVVDMPDHLSFEEGAALPLAGLTAWRALMTQGKLLKGQKLLITGIGGGVALAALKFAVHLGVEVYVTSGSRDKIDKAIVLGAVGGANYKDLNFISELKSLAGHFDVILDSAGGPDFGSYLKLCRPGGKIVVYGGTQGKVEIVPQHLYWSQVSIIGSTMGTSEEFADMITFIDQHKLKPVIDSIIPLSEYKDGFEKMNNGSQFGKIVFTI